MSSSGESKPSTKPCDDRSPTVEQPVVEPDIWSTLLPELLVEIFGYLNTRDKNAASLVCRSWRDAVCVPMLWNKTEVKVWADRLNRSTISGLVDRGVRRVKIWTDFHATRLDGETVASRIGELVAAMTDIEHLDVFGCYYSHIGDRLATAIKPLQLTALTRLKMSSFHRVSGRSLMIVANSCPNIEDLDLSRYLAHKYDVLIPEALHKFSRLRRLNLTAGEMVDTDMVKVMLASPAPPLDTLVLDQCPGVTDATIEFVVRGLPLLKSLSVVGVRGLTELSGRHVASARLDELGIAIRDATDVPADKFRCLSDAGVMMNHVRMLEVSNYMNDSAVRLLANVHARGQCPNLVALKIPDSAITDDALQAIASIRTLRELCISCCSRITDVGIAHLASGQLTLLNSLDLENCSRVTEWFETSESHHLESLKHIDLNYTNISDDGVLKLIVGSPRLKWIGIGFCQRVTELSLERIASTLPDIEGIDLEVSSDMFPFLLKGYSYSDPSWYSYIGTDGLDQLLQLPRLRRIAVMEFQKELRDLIADRRPDIEICRSPSYDKFIRVLTEGTLYL